VAQDVCDRYAVDGLRTRHPAIRLSVVRDAMRPIDPAAGERLLRQWGDEGVRIVETEDIVAKGLLDSLTA
jgi:hypothetical protein